VANGAYSLLGIDSETFERIWQHPLKTCWKKTKKGLVNSRLEDERKWAKQRSKRATEAALTKWPEDQNGQQKQHLRNGPSHQMATERNDDHL
jgi:hypothetical protein